jgi:hypothetical protein
MSDPTDKKRLNCLLKRPQRKSRSLLIPITLQVKKMIPKVSRTSQMVKNNLDHEDNKNVAGQEPASARRMSVFSHPSPGDLGISRHHGRSLAGSHAFVALFMPSLLHHLSSDDPI